MSGILSRRKSTGKLPPAANKRWEAINALMRNPSRLIAIAAEEEPRWRWRCSGAGMLGADDFDAVDILKGWAAEARIALQERCTKLSSAARIGWKQWVEEQLQKGAGALHRYTKREDIAP